MTRISSHVLDTALGRPAAGVRIRFEQRGDGEAWRPLGEQVTDEDGRVADLAENAALAPGSYRLCFETGAYFVATSRPVFFPRVDVLFEVAAGASHYHVPLLLSPFGYSTYRGS